MQLICLHCLQYNFPSSHGNGDALGKDVTRIPFPDIIIRPGTDLDTHLSSQPFSRCTVPVVRCTLLSYLQFLITNISPQNLKAIARYCTKRCSAWHAQPVLPDSSDFLDHKHTTPSGVRRTLASVLMGQCIVCAGDDHKLGHNLRRSHCACSAESLRLEGKQCNWGQCHLCGELSSFPLTTLRREDAS